jgi:hypothetical protein
VAEGVVEDTIEEFEAHPFWIVGGVLAIVVLIWIARRGSSGQSANFTFSTGPTTDQIKAADALTLGQDQLSTQASINQVDTAATTQQTKDYLSYLTGANNNATNLSLTTANQNYQLTAQEQVYTANQKAIDSNIGYQEALQTGLLNTQNQAELDQANLALTEAAQGYAISMAQVAAGQKATYG